MIKTRDRLGNENYNTYGTLMKIVIYNKATDIVVEFQDEYKYRKRCAYKEFKNGTVKNPYDRVICNVGYIGKDGQCNGLFYDIWTHMVKRCYDPYELNKYPTYIDCYVCDEWLNYSNFEKWCYANYYKVLNEKMCLDKDILIKGNKIYSPKTCIFVPERINLLFCKSEKTRGKYPIGVSEFLRKQYGYRKLRSYCNVYNEESNRYKQKHLGYFPLDKPFQAFYTYKQFKENYIKQVANEYKDLIPLNLYNALYSWEVEIND